MFSWWIPQFLACPRSEAFLGRWDAGKMVADWIRPPNGDESWKMATWQEMSRHFFWRGTCWKFTTLDTAWWCVVSPKFCDSHIGHIFCNDTTHEMIEKTSFWSRRIIFCRVCHSVRTLGERTLWQRKLRKLILLPFRFWLLKAAPNLGTVGWCGNSF